MADEKKRIGLLRSKVKNGKKESELLVVTSDAWVVSIVRIPKGKYPEHVFLLLEGVNKENKLVVRRYDLVKHDKREGYAQILILPIDAKEADVATVASLTKGQEVRCQSWHIQPSQAEKLHEDIFNDHLEAENFSGGIIYSVFGSDSYSGSSSSHQGHNCFTWAREKLSKLGESAITDDIKPLITDCFAVQPSLYLPDPSDSRFNVKNIALGIGGLLVLGAGALMSSRGFFSGAGNLRAMSGTTGVMPPPPPITPPTFASTLNHLGRLSSLNRFGQ